MEIKQPLQIFLRVTAALRICSIIAYIIQKDTKY